MTLGQKVKQFRQKRGLSQRELAKLVGMSHTHLVNIETDKISPTVHTLQRIAKGLGVKPARLLPDT